MKVVAAREEYIRLKKRKMLLTKYLLGGILVIYLTIRWILGWKLLMFLALDCVWVHQVY